MKFLHCCGLWVSARACYKTEEQTPSLEPIPKRPIVYPSSCIAVSPWVGRRVCNQHSTVVADRQRHVHPSTKPTSPRDRQLIIRHCMCMFLPGDPIPCTQRPNTISPHRAVVGGGVHDTFAMISQPQRDVVFIIIISKRCYFYTHSNETIYICIPLSFITCDKARREGFHMNDKDSGIPPTAGWLPGGPLNSPQKFFNPGWLISDHLNYTFFLLYSDFHFSATQVAKCGMWHYTALYSIAIASFPSPTLYSYTYMYMYN